MRREPGRGLIAAGGTLVATLAVVALLAPWLAPGDPHEQLDPAAGRLRPPGTVLAAVELEGGRWLLADRVERTADGLRIWRRGDSRLLPADEVANLTVDGVADRRRFLRHLKPWYDVNRYRMVPQVGAMIADAETAGRLRFLAARIVEAAPDGDRLRVGIRRRGSTIVERAVYGAVINCTGPRSMPLRGTDPFIDSLIDSGLARPDPAGLGLDIGEDCRLLGRDGSASDALWTFGLLTRGRFGEMTAVPQISLQLTRVLPQVCATIQEAAARNRT